VEADSGSTPPEEGWAATSRHDNIIQVAKSVGPADPNGRLEELARLAQFIRFAQSLSEQADLRTTPYGVRRYSGWHIFDTPT
jgi:hypothetical protein